MRSEIIRQKQQIRHKAGSPADRPHSRDIGGGVRISSLCTGETLLTEPFEGVRTFYDAFYRGHNMNPSHDCLGSRTGDRYHWISYQQLESRVKNFGSALIRETGTNYVGIIGINCIDWVVTQLGCVFYNRVFVPMYDTLGDEAMSHILQQTECQVVVAHPGKIAKVLTFLRAGPHCVKTVVKMVSSPTAEERAQFEELNVTIRSVAEMEEIGARDPQPVTPPDASDVYTVCYTSGTTGIPKGALITHENMTTTMAGVIASNRDFLLSPGQIHFSYLPLCHLFEMSVHLFVYTSGAAIGIYSGNPAELPEDIRVLRPTVFPAVPRVLNKFRDKILSGVAEKPAPVRWLFARALASKYADLERGVFQQNIWDKLVFRKIREAFGGRISLIATGAAPILPETLHFFRAVFGANVYEGYGQTESTAGCTFTQPGDFLGGHVGPPLPTNLIKLVDSETTGHFVANGKGEVCVKGRNVFKGYFKDPLNTAAALDADNWLHTGDIGEWTESGCLKIIDRKKYIFKTSHGEYIAPEKIENIYELHDLVQQMFIDGDSTKPIIAAVVIPNEDPFMKWAGKPELSYSQLLADPEVNSRFLSFINQSAKQKLKTFELISKIRLVDVALTVENDLVTPTFKKKRPSLKRHFSLMFDTMYGESNN